MKSRQVQETAGAPERVPEAKPGSLYASLLGSEAQARLAANATLYDDLALLRTQVRLLALTIDVTQEREALKKLQVLAQMLRTVATLERVRLAGLSAAGSPGAGLQASLPQLMAAVSPHKKL